MINIAKYQIEHGANFKLEQIQTDDTAKLRSKSEAEKYLDENIEKIAALQGKLYAQDKYALLLIFQGMDTAGKDGAIKHVMAGLNPQATQVHSFKQPSLEELNHDYLWRVNCHLPERGRIGIFNRSYYEEVLVVRVHNLVNSQQIPAEFITGDLWQDRFRQIRDYEKYLQENGIIPVKLFLHISRAEQKRRLLERIDDNTKNWKFADADIKERGYWKQYQQCYQDAITATATKQAPWYVIPSDKKWFSRLVISEIIVQTLANLKLEYPAVTVKQREILTKYQQMLLTEPDEAK